uniref:Conserved hypothetical membrane protein n=1 Tax=Paulinella chromatophora TaxID=39717 RepID=A1XYT8_PAUCH|nr:hypothetical protein PCC_0683 [Paulinella chromatophora]ABH09258.1 glutathione S-transferase [Paulinella chromatophora]ACB43101.1 conserved hypothetical membrane protein [Paulinella chromatophora]
MTNSVFEGIYGTFTIDSMDRREVLGYRLALSGVGISLLCLLLQWAYLGGSDVWPWFLSLSICLGLALRWIHIYLRSLHRTLQLFWLIGVISLLVISIRIGINQLLPLFIQEPLYMLSVAPLFASLVGVGFKEFFCFRRIEAVGLTLLIPIALLGQLSGLINLSLSFILFITAALCILVLSVRKFSTDIAADVGDKSVFTYVENQRK